MRQFNMRSRELGEPAESFITTMHKLFEQHNCAVLRTDTRSNSRRRQRQQAIRKNAAGCKTNAEKSRDNDNLSKCIGSKNYAVHHLSLQ